MLFIKLDTAHEIILTLRDIFNFICYIFKIDNPIIQVSIKSSTLHIDCNVVKTKLVLGTFASIQDVFCLAFSERNK